MESPRACDVGDRGKQFRVTSGVLTGETRKDGTDIPGVELRRQGAGQEATTQRRVRDDADTEDGGCRDQRSLDVAVNSDHSDCTAAIG